MWRTFLPSTDNKPERIHSVKPVPRTTTWCDGDQLKQERGCVSEERISTSYSSSMVVVGWQGGMSEGDHTQVARIG